MDRVLISIGPVTIYWYSFLIFLSILIGLVITKRELKKTSIDEEFFFDLVFYLIPPPLPFKVTNHNVIIIVGDNFTVKFSTRVLNLVVSGQYKINSV